MGVLPLTGGFTVRYRALDGRSEVGAERHARSLIRQRVKGIGSMPISCPRFPADSLGVARVGIHHFLDAGGGSWPACRAKSAC